MPTIRVDGNDPLAVYAATAEARRIAVEEGRPTLIEAMTYRIGPHSTSDDDSKYRCAEPPEPGYANERAYWEARSPIVRFGAFLRARGLWDSDREEQLRTAARAEAIGALNAAKKVGRPTVEKLFTDVYDSPPWILREQQQALAQHMRRHAPHYAEWDWGSARQHASDVYAKEMAAATTDYV